MGDNNHELHEKTDRLISLNRFEALVATLVGICAIVSTIGAWYILPYRMSQIESRVNSMEAQRQADHDVLIEIREDVKHLIEAKERDGTKAHSPRNPN